jgi:UDP-N-acetylglucosamine 2-epimerase (non-hydrolysing)
MTKKFQNRVLFVTGTRPEIIKMAPLYFQLKLDGFFVQWCHTGQHDTLASQTFEVFGIQPDFTFNRPQSVGISSLLGGLLNNVEALLNEHRFDAVLVHGDTSSTLAGALAAFYDRIPIIAHVEAGLRSHNLSHPFPEESNRVLVAKIANCHFAPTPLAADALYSERIDEKSVFITGNTAVDAQLLLLEKGIIERTTSNQVLVTAHRRENWPNMTTICRALQRLSELRPELDITFAVHPNPELTRTVNEALKDVDNITVSQPLDYLDLQKMIAKSCLVITDSGGIQEEAPTFGTPVVVLRETTERPEAVESGYSVLAGSQDIDLIVDNCIALLDKGRFDMGKNPFGDGKASQRISSELAKQCYDLS